MHNPYDLILNLFMINYNYNNIIIMYEYND